MFRFDPLQATFCVGVSTRKPEKRRRVFCKKRGWVEGRSPQLLLSVCPEAETACVVRSPLRFEGFCGLKAGLRHLFFFFSKKRGVGGRSPAICEHYYRLFP